MAYYVRDLDGQNQWYWIFHADNGKPIARSSESYKNRGDCDHSIELMKTLGPTAEVRDGLSAWYQTGT